MVLINLDLLSDAELRYIARQEGFSDWETLDREDLTEQLQEKYEEEDEGGQPSRDTIRFRDSGEKVRAVAWCRRASENV